MRDRSDGLSLAGRWTLPSAQKPAPGWLLVPPLQPATFILPAVPLPRTHIKGGFPILGGLGITSPAGVVAPCLEGPVIRGVIFEEDGYGST